MSAAVNQGAQGQATGKAEARSAGLALPAELAGRAAIIGAAREGAFPISFATLFLAFFAMRDPFSRWLQRTAPELGARVQRIHGVSEDVMDRARAARSPFAQTEISPSVMGLLEETAHIANEVGQGAAESAVVFAAYCRASAGHERDLRAWGFDPEEWTRRLLAWIALRRPRDLEPWLHELLGEPEDTSATWLSGVGADQDGEVTALHVLDFLVFDHHIIAAPSDWQRSTQPAKPSPSREVEWSAEVDRWLALARVVSVAHPPSEHDMLTAAIIAPAGALPTVEAWLADHAELRSRSAHEWTASSADAERAEMIREIWAAGDVPSLAPFDNDEARGGADRLQFDRDVGALAQLIAANEAHGIKPPLSIGLFGDWGTGKTFFMDMLERMIDELKASGEPAFCEHIVQIRFNAWHYMDANLWASVACHIFEQLHVKLYPREDDQRTAARLEKDLASARDEKAKIDREQAALTAQLDELRKQAADAERERKERQLRLDDLRAGTLWRAIADTEAIKQPLGELYGALAWVQSLKRVLTPWTMGFAAAALVALAAGIWLGTALLAKVVPLVISAIALVQRAWALARAKLPSSKDIEAAFHKVVDEIRTTPTEAEIRLRGETAEATVRQQALVAACAALEADIARLAAEKARVEDGLSFAHYVGQRVQSDDYRKQLGIVSLLHRDFDALSERLRQRAGSGPRIDRIVLYVDDLDRCPADKVVQVLQAVHLLLAFPLFVVVVAVDPTWVLRSLEDHYTRQMGSEPTARLEAATPHAYLEKIFQIPMRVRPMTPAAYRDLLDGLAGAQVASLVGPPDDGPADRDIAEGDEREEPADDGFAYQSPDLDRRPSAPPELTGDSLALGAHELTYLKRLADLIPTPRAAKRVVNVYRLIRAQLPAAERPRFLRTEDGTFHAVMLFLALNAKFPAPSLALFERIAASPAGWAELCDRLASEHPDDPDWQRMWQAMAMPMPMPQEPGARPGAEEERTFVLTRLSPAQLAQAAALAMRFSLPGARAAREASGSRTVQPETAQPETA